MVIGSYRAALLPNVEPGGGVVLLYGDNSLSLSGIVNVEFPRGTHGFSIVYPATQASGPLIGTPPKPPDIQITIVPID